MKSDDIGSESRERPADREARSSGGSVWGSAASGKTFLLTALLRPRGIDLRNADLSGLDLTGAMFRRADLYRANLSRTKLRGANLVKAVLIEANLREADLQDADCFGADFRGSAMEGTNLSNAVFGWTTLGDLDLSSVEGLEKIVHRAPSTLGINSVYASNARIPERFLRGCGASESFIAYARSLVGTPQRFYSCFISYSHADRSFARQVYESLQTHGIRCWLDEKHMLPGDDIYDQVDRGIRLWDKFLLCCSKHSLSPASWVDREIATALDKEHELTKQQRRTVRSVIPLDLDGYLFSDEWQSGYRAEIRRRLAADFTGWESNNTRFESAVEDVIRGLRTDPPRETRQPKM